MKAFFGLVKERLECVAVHSGADLCLLRNRNNISYIGLFRFLLPQRRVCQIIRRPQLNIELSRFD